MASIDDYLRWRGDLSFAERPFNDVDNVVMALLAYLDLRGIVDGAGAEAVTVADALGRLLAAGGDLQSRVCSIAAIDAELLRLVAGSRRFGTALLRDYVDVVDPARALQFSAYTADTPDGLTVVAFRGTDHSLAGWRENFMLGFTVTEAQERAAAYLERAVARAAAEGRRVVVCGHSKGGNLAAFAALSCPADLRDHIAHVWSDDGPGLAPEVVPTSAREALGGRFTHVVPRHSVVGMLFADAAGEDLVVASSAAGVMQHDPTTWEADAFGLVPAALAADSRMVASAFASWLDGVDLEAREAFVNELFDALAAGDPERIDAVLASPASTQRVIAAAIATSADAKGVAAKLASAARTTATSAAASAARRAAAAAVAAARETLAEAQDALRELRPGRAPGER